MRGQRDLDLVVDVEPFGIVVALFGDQRDPRHEGESLREIREFELALDRVAVAGERPCGQRGEPARALFLGQLGDVHRFSEFLSASAHRRWGRSIDTSVSPATIANPISAFHGSRTTNTAISARLIARTTPITRGK